MQGFKRFQWVSKRLRSGFLSREEFLAIEMRLHYEDGQAGLQCVTGCPCFCYAAFAMVFPCYLIYYGTCQYYPTPPRTHTLHVNISVNMGHTSDGKRCVCAVSSCDVFHKMGQNENEKRDLRVSCDDVRRALWVLLHVIIYINYKRDHINPMRLRKLKSLVSEKKPIMYIILSSLPYTNMLE